jgi:hypothetical protein
MRREVCLSAASAGTALKIIRMMKRINAVLSFIADVFITIGEDNKLSARF